MREILLHLFLIFAAHVLVVYMSLSCPVFPFFYIQSDLFFIVTDHVPLLPCVTCFFLSNGLKTLKLSTDDLSAILLELCIQIAILTATSPSVLFSTLEQFDPGLENRCCLAPGSRWSNPWSSPQLRLEPSGSQSLSTDLKGCYYFSASFSIPLGDWTLH